MHGPTINPIPLRQRHLPPYIDTCIPISNWRPYMGAISVNGLDRRTNILAAFFHAGRKLRAPMHEDHWGTSGMFGKFGLCVYPCGNGYKEKAQYFKQVAPFQSGDGFLSVCAQIKINLLIYPTLLGLHLHDCPQHHPCHSGHWFPAKTSCTIRVVDEWCGWCI